MRHITQINLPMAILLSVGCIGFWVPDFITPLSGNWGGLIGTLLLTFLNAFCFTLLVYQRGITRKLEGLTFVLYLLAISVLPALHTQWLLQVVVLLFQLTLGLVLRAYRNNRAVEPAFLSALLLGVTALIVPDVVFLLPVVWLMFVVQRAMSLRVFLASLIGASVVLLYSVLFSKLGWIQLVDWTDIWVRNMNGVRDAINGVSTIVIAVCGLFFAIANLTHQNIENTAITIFVWCMILAFLPCAVLMFFPPAYFASLFVLALYGLVALATYFFLSRESVFAGVTFLIFIALFIGIFFVL